MIKHIGKLLIKNRSDDTYLLLNRSDHPRYGTDPDLPGGTLEPGENIEETTVREVMEEIGVAIDKTSIELLYRGDEYSSAHNFYNLYYVELDNAPSITLDWEHSAYHWYDAAEFLDKSCASIDSYMHMVADILEKQLAS